MSVIRNITPDKCEESYDDKRMLSSRHRLLVKYQISNNLRRQISNTRLGILWLIINPLVTSLIYVFVFTVMSANVDAMSIIIGIGIFRVFGLSVRSGIASINDYRGGILAERISTRVLTLGMIGSRIVNAQLQTLGVGIVLILIFKTGIFTAIFLMIFATICAITIEGIMLNFAKLIRNLPDLNNLIQHSLQLMFYLSPVLYNFERTSGIHRQINTYNPLTYFIEPVRSLANGGSNWDFIENELQVLLIVFLLIIFSLKGYMSLDKVRWEVSSWS
jgi:ABC-type polysaccharide/polyol phosphate export permease